jgi:hypothetical protein
LRLRQDEIEYATWQIVKKLKESGEVEFFDSEDEAREKIRHAMTEDLMVEDKLNREVDDILRAHQNEIQRESVDYRGMFQLIKKKLAKERGLIL